MRDILAIMEDHLDAFDVIVDVFGGSGKVLLNVLDDWKKGKIYNDLDDNLYITFKVLQDTKKRLALTRKLRLAFAHEKAFIEMRMKKVKFFLRFKSVEPCRIADGLAGI
ncbi:MAG: DNA adenine methylase [Thermoplasmataceae archaeon]